MTETPVAEPEEPYVTVEQAEKAGISTVVINAYQNRGLIPPGTTRIADWVFRKKNGEPFFDAEGNLFWKDKVIARDGDEIEVVNIRPIGEPEPEPETEEEDLRDSEDITIVPATQSEATPPPISDAEEPFLPPAEKDSIVEAYDALKSEIADCQEAFSFWNHTLNDPIMVAFLDKMQGEIDQKKLDWENIKPRDFMESQSRVQALSHMLEQLRGKEEEAKAALASKRQLQVNMETNYSLFLQGGNE